MSGSASRDKGSRGEREALKLLGGELGSVLTRNLLQTREGGADCTQIKGWALEVKRCETLKLPAWWRQACSQAVSHESEPALLWRQNRQPWRARWGWDAKEGGLVDFASAVREKEMMWP